jgi:tetratricopeptide (TPR) repeat protein
MERREQEPPAPDVSENSTGIAPEWSGLTTDSVPSARGEKSSSELVLPKRQMGASSEESSPSASEAMPGPDVPHIDPNNITPALLNQVIELSREYPNNQDVREAVGRAYLALAYQLYSRGRFQESLEAAETADSWGAEPRDVARVCARACLELRNMSEALNWAQSGLAFGPDADMYFVLGKVFYLREEMDKAIEAWKSALALREDRETRAALEKALRESRVADSFDRQRLSHFIVRYEGGEMEETGRMVLGSLERSYAFLKSTLGFAPDEPIIVILYARREYAELGGPRWSAGLFDGKVRVPVRGLESLDKHVEGTLRHELTHAFIHAQAGDNCPRWLHEGIAEYCEGSRSEQYGKMLAQKIEQDGDLSYCLKGQRCDVRYFYPAATSLLEYMIQSRGIGGIRDILSHLGDGRDIDTALEEVMGRDEMGLIQEWQRFVRRRYL